MLTRRDALRLLATRGAGLLAADAFLFAGQSQAPTELLIRGGRVVNADGARDVDVRVVGDLITEIRTGLRPNPGSRVIEAAGKLVMPGGVDPHTHIEGYSVDNLRIGSMAALAGGITTVGTFAYAEKGQTLQQAIDRLVQQARTDAIADVFFHAQTWPLTAETVDAMPAIAAAGHPSFKLYLPEEDFGAQIHTVVRLIEAARDAGVVTLAHCEDAAIISAAIKRLIAAGRTSVRNYAAGRPVTAEVSATAQIAALCESTGAPMYVVHLSSARALDACRQSRLAGAPLYVETRPLYLHLTEERLAGADGPLFVGQPPLRSAADAKELWRGLADGSIDVLGSDHAPFTRVRKMDPALSISNTLPGMSDLQFMLPMYFSEGVHKRRLSLTKFVATTSTNAARIFGMYPQKGVIREGSDADIVVWNPQRTGKVTAEADLSDADYSVYEGWNVTGWPELTIRRGEVVSETGQVSGQAGTGRVISRARWHR